MLCGVNSFRERFENRRLVAPEGQVVETAERTPHTGLLDRAGVRTTLAPE